MAGKAYLTQTGVGVKIKKMYVVENGKTVKLKKAYGVIDGKTVKLWSGGELVYYGTLADVAIGSESDQTGSSNDNYAMISGTRTIEDLSVYAYNKSLTLNKTAKLSTARNKMACGTVGEYVLFGAGYYSSSERPLVVDAFNNSLTRTNPADMTTWHFEYSGGRTGANVGDYIIFNASGGLNKDVYNKSLTKSLLAYESGDAYGTSNKSCAVGDVEDYAIFIGGNGSTKLLAMAVDKSLTKRTIDFLTTNKCQSAVANVGGKVLFAGGRSTGGGILATVEAYDNSLTHTVLPSLSVARWYVAGATVEGYALFAGGYNNSGGYTNNSVDIVDVYDESLTRTVATTPLSQARCRAVGMTIGNYVIFASGQLGTGADVGTVDVYEVS